MQQANLGIVAILFAVWKIYIVRFATLNSVIELFVFKD